MKSVCKFAGKFFLAIAALVIMAGPASFGGVAVEEMPESIKSKR